MKQFYYTFTLSQLTEGQLNFIENGQSTLGHLGIEYYNFEESTVDDVLGEKSYSGGDVDQIAYDMIEDYFQSNSDSIKVFFNDKNNVENFKNYLNNENISYEFTTDEVKDWNESWKDSFSKISVSDEVAVYPSWDESIKLEKFAISIYPGMGFGTGTHQTTFLCLQMLSQERNLNPLNILDFGCGSGILGIMAKKIFQSSNLDMIDIDENALINCRQNTEINNCQQNVRVLHTDQTHELYPKYDLIFANILLSTLEAEKNTILNLLNKNGILYVSGLLRGQENQIIESYLQFLPSLKVFAVETKDDWVAIKFKYE